MGYRRRQTVKMRTHSQRSKARSTWNSEQKKRSRTTYTNITHAPTIGMRKTKKNIKRFF